MLPTSKLPLLFLHVCGTAFGHYKNSDLLKTKFSAATIISKFHLINP
jgi:hypothetical protein